MERTSVTLSRDLGMDDMECNSLPNDMLDVGALGPVELTVIDAAQLEPYL